MNVLCTWQKKCFNLRDIYANCWVLKASLDIDHMYAVTLPKRHIKTDVAYQNGSEGCSDLQDQTEERVHRQQLFLIHYYNFDPAALFLVSSVSPVALANVVVMMF